jgi:hypothetical protein
MMLDSRSPVAVGIYFLAKALLSGFSGAPPRWPTNLEWLMEAFALDACGAAAM